MKIASLQYRYDFHKNFKTFKKKISDLVALHAKQHVNLLVFPEYAGLEMLSFTAIESLQEHLPQYMELFQELSHKYNMLICNGSQIVMTADGTFNRSYLFSPNKKVSFQDKCIITPYEVKEGLISQGTTLRLFETSFGTIAICICYDAEFPSLVKSVVNAGASLILVPSYTSSVHGFYRVLLSCRARALENQCYVVQSTLVGQTDVEIAYGASAICSPVDEGFPEDGLIALGKRDKVLSVIATIDLHKLDKVRTSGQTHNYIDAKKLDLKSIPLQSFDLR